MSSMTSTERVLGFPLFFLVLINFIAISPVSSQNSTAIQHVFQYDSYRETCRDAEKIVWNGMKNITLKHQNAQAQLLRLLFHDCFIQFIIELVVRLCWGGCDASVLLLDDMNSTERHAGPNTSLKGFDYIDEIKELLESECPGVVSCADILVLATRDAIVLSGGPYYPVLTGRKDSTRSYSNEAVAEIPKPESNISEILQLFARRGFNERETATLLGAHNIGRISCVFIQPRLNKSDDGAIPKDFLSEMKTNCLKPNGSITNTRGGEFGSHYYEALIRGKGLLTSDQELLAHEKTAEAVFEYAEDGDKFRSDFASAMVKLSNLNVAGSQGEVRRNCSSANSS
ncbi:hypothetical protein OROHE_010516 [Orobanche hederae]